jgi:hypothetical protein
MSSGYNTIKKMVYELFEIRKKKDLEKDKLLHFYGNRFTRFSEGPPYRRLSITEALREEQEFFSKTSNYDFEIEDLQDDTQCNDTYKQASIRGRVCMCYLQKLPIKDHEREHYHDVLTVFTLFQKKS